MRVILLFTVLLTVNQAYGQVIEKYKKLVGEAEEFYDSKKYAKASEKYKEAFQISGGKAFDKDRFNAARSFSMSNEIDSSFFQLTKLANNTFKDFEKLNSDSAFKNLYKHKRWEELLLKVKSNENKSGIIFYVDKNVTNRNKVEVTKIIKLFKDYLKSGTYRKEKNVFWDFEGMKIPDDFIWAIGTHNLLNRVPPVQCKIIGVYPVKNNAYAIKSVFSHIDQNNEIQLDNIITVYARKIKNEYKLLSSTQYHKKVWRKEQIGGITYYIHPEHTFDLNQAKKMDKFNDSISGILKTAPLKLEYFTTNYSREIVQVLGYDYMPRMYRPEQTGGLADVNNNIIYAGNNSEYYPHELVHLYINKIATKPRHFLVEEGIAALFGGSSGYSLDWHLKKLKEYLEKTPDFDFSTLDELKTDIPNGEFLTDLRYVIGGLVSKKVYEKEGIHGIYEALDYGSSDNDFYRLIKDKLNIKKADFISYIKSELKKY